MKLSAHFSLEEMIKSQTALRHGLSNFPTLQEIDCLKLVVKEILEPARLYYDVPISPSSGYRSPEVNRLVGSKPTSQHILGQAVDFEVPGVPNIEVAKWISGHCKTDQVILEFYHGGNTGWIHASVIETGNRGDRLVFDGDKFSNF